MSGSKCDRCGETVSDIDAGFLPAAHGMRHDCGGTWRRAVSYEISYTDGRLRGGFASVDDAIEVLEREYPELDYGHDGDVEDGGERTLVWASRRDARDDDGARAVASIRAERP